MELDCQRKRVNTQIHLELSFYDYHFVIIGEKSLFLQKSKEHIMNNPFVTNGYVAPEYFCDREKETEKIVSLLTNENNVALISPRRIGKTDLLHHCFRQPEIKEKYHTFVIDIYATSSVRDFVNVFGKAVLDELRPKGKSVWEGFLNVLSSLRSEISFDINGQPTWGIGLGAITNPIATLDEIFNYLNHADKPCLVAIDEFQQITKYGDDANIEAALRTYIQRCHNAHFVFSGSHRHLMGAMFTSPARPFYQSVTLINLAPISLEKYQSFCQMHFERNGKSLDNEVVPQLYERFEGITSYMQRTMNILFSMTQKGNVCTNDMIDIAIKDLIDLSSDTYETLLYQMPEKQRALFIAIASAGKAKAINGSEFVRKYHLSSASSVASAAKGLLEKDFITNDKGTYQVYDLFFKLWLQRTKL